MFWILLSLSLSCEARQVLQTRFYCMLWMAYLSWSSSYLVDCRVQSGLQLEGHRDVVGLNNNKLGNFGIPLPLWLIPFQPIFSGGQDSVVRLAKWCWTRYE